MVPNPRIVGTRRGRSIIHLEQKGFSTRDVALNGLGGKCTCRILIRETGTLDLVAKAPVPQQIKIALLRAAAREGVGPERRRRNKIGKVQSKQVLRRSPLDSRSTQPT
jgi:hypothetical protein